MQEREQRELPVHSVHAPIKTGALSLCKVEGNESLLLTKEERMARCLVGAVERHQRTSGSLTAEGMMIEIKRKRPALCIF